MPAPWTCPSEPTFKPLCLVPEQQEQTDPPTSVGTRRRSVPPGIVTGRLGTWGSEVPMRVSDTSDVWWKTAVVYCLDVQTFMDWNDDGMGDFTGLAERLDYLSELGVTCLWLMPFYPTTDRDDGYDITD